MIHGVDAQAITYRSDVRARPTALMRNASLTVLNRCRAQSHSSTPTGLYSTRRRVQARRGGVQAP